MARPSSFDPKYVRIAHRLCLLGATDKDIAAALGVSISTVSEWKNQFPEFMAALKDGKEGADAHVASSLYGKATGYKHIAFKMFQHEGKVITKRYVEHFAPDTVACIFWLKNRRPDLWRDRVEHTGAGGKELIAPGDERELAKAIAFILTGQTPPPAEPEPDQPRTVN